VAVELDVVIDVDARILPTGDLEARGRQRPQRRGVERFEGAAPAASELLEGPGVQIDQQLGDRGVERGQAQETPVSQPRQNPVRIPV